MQPNAARFSGKQQFVLYPLLLLPSATSTLCPPFANLNHRQCTEFPLTHSRVLTPSPSLFLAIFLCHSLLFFPSLLLIRPLLLLAWLYFECLLNLGFYFLSSIRYPSRRILSIVFLAYYFQVDFYRHITITSWWKGNTSLTLQTPLSSLYDKQRQI